MKESRNNVMYQVVEKKSAYLDLNVGIKATEIATKNICEVNVRIVVTPSLTLKLSHSATKKQFCKKKKRKSKT